MPRPARVPAYCRHKGTGQAVVRLGGRDHYLGPYGSPKSIEKYQRLTAKFLSAGGRLPPDEDDGFTVTELIVAFFERCEEYYRKDGKPTSEVSAIRSALRPVRALYGDTQAADFGPLDLKVCRDQMIEFGWARKSINQHMSRIKRMFKWGGENELVPAGVFHTLQTVAGLREGRSAAVESEPVRPVPDEFVDAIRAHVSRQIWAMVELQRLTGMRSGEVTTMRTGDLTTSGSVWIYVPESHKTEHHGRQREIYLGPQAQEIVRPFLKTDLAAYLFSPREAQAERLAEMRSNRKTPVQPSQRDRGKPNAERKPGELYTVDSYRKAVQRGITKANEQRAKDDLPAIPKWFPHQLRHNAATKARMESGLEAAQVICGHAKADVTQIYAEQNRTKAIEYMKRHG